MIRYIIGIVIASLVFVNILLGWVEFTSCHDTHNYECEIKWMIFSPIWTQP